MASQAPTHASDHGVRAFDPDLAAHAYDSVARGDFRILHTHHGRYYAIVRVDTRLGHVCAAVHLERAAAEGILSAGASANVAPIFDRATHAAATVAEQLDLAAQERGTAPEVLSAAKALLRAKMGDRSARGMLAQLMERARAGDPRSQRCVKVLHVARAFIHDAVGQTSSGNMFDDIGHVISHTVKDVSHAVRDVSRTASHAVQDVKRTVEHAEKDVERAAMKEVRAIVPHEILNPVNDVVHAVKQWGPLVLSSVEGLISLVPGIGTGISSALAMAVALLEGGSPLNIAIHAAYGAIPIPPGIRNITDTVLDTVLAFLAHPESLSDALLQGARDRIPKGLPQDVFDTLVRIVVKRQPILKVAEDVALHQVTKYTKGLSSALTQTLSKAAPAITATLARLPNPSVAFKSIHDIAPNFSISPAMVPHLLEHAQGAAGVHLATDLAAALASSATKAVVADARAQPMGVCCRACSTRRARSGPARAWRLSSPRTASSSALSQVHLWRHSSRL